MEKDKRRNLKETATTPRGEGGGYTPVAAKNPL